MTAPSVFLAHPKSMDPEKREHVASLVGQLFYGFGDEVRVVTGHDDYMQYGPSAGSFDSWSRDVVDRTDMMTMQPVYKAIVVTQMYFGKATALIVQRALAKKRPVFVFIEDDADKDMLFRVVDLITIDKDDFISGWTVEHLPIGT
jgi:hypothetical protein